jgi:nitrite reductase/ring-hydroxylating ferredoxin subunit
MDHFSDKSNSTRQPTTAPNYPEVPWSWQYACQLKDLVRGPVNLSVGAREFVLFADGYGRIAAMDRRCVHMGADLANGCVVQERIRCPFHQWEFNQQGQCVHIPATDSIPVFARQQVYPTAVLGPHVLLFNRAQPLFDAPYFDGLTQGDLLAAKPFEFEAELPWYMVAANGFDLQHFRAAHDRTLVEEPVISRPSPFAYRIRAIFDVTGNSLRDRLTRRFSGNRVTMTVTSWCGTLVLVTAEFARTTSYGMVCVRPLDRNRSVIRNIVWVPRRSGLLHALDPVDAMVRRWFIRGFVESDRERSKGIRYNPGSLIDADAVLAGYFKWLAETVNGESLNR